MAVGKSKKPKRHKMPFPVFLLILGIITPIELSPVIGSLHMLPHRVAILVFIFPALKRVFASKLVRTAAYDWLFVAFNAWMLFIFMAHMDWGPGLQYGGSLVVESLGGYVIARAYIRTYDDFIATLSGLFKAVCFVGVLAIPEVLTGNHYVHTSLRFIGGVMPSASDEVRWGLHRSYATFNHPILYGAFCASILSMVWSTGGAIGGRIPKVIAIVLATFFGLSSAPLNTLVVQSALGGIHKATTRFPNRMKVLGLMFVALYMFLLVTSDQSPIASIVTRITIDPQTGYYRTLIWGFGLQNVWAHPWFGLGLDDWWRPEWMHSVSVDAYWLIVTMQQGIPAIMLLISAIWLLIAAVHKRGPGQRPRQEQRASVGWTLSFTAFALAGCTVHYWDSAHTYLFFLLGMSTWLADPVKSKLKAKAKPRAKSAELVDDEPIPTPLPWPEPAYAARYVEASDPRAG